MDDFKISRHLCTPTEDVSKLDLENLFNRAGVQRRLVFETTPPSVRELQILVAPPKRGGLTGVPRS